jgi:hypothetical protein
MDMRNDENKSALDAYESGIHTGWRLQGRRPTTTASNLFRRALCPGSARLEAGLPDEESEESREGTLLHDYFAHPEYDRAMLKPNQRDLLELADTLTKTVIDRVELEQDLIGKPHEDYPEKLLDEEILSGRPDWFRHYELDGKTNVTLVIDRKFGFTAVERADLNLQLRAYALLAADYNFCAFSATGQVFAAIVQPRAPFDERITIARYTPEDIEDSRKQILSILEAAAQSDAPLVPGELQCHYCKAKLICPAFREAIEKAPALMSIGDALTKTAREAYLVQRLAECSDEQLTQMIDAIRLAAYAKDPALDEARKRIAAGALSKFRLTKGAEVRIVNDVRKALALLNLAGLPKDEIYDCITNLSLTKIGDVVRKANPGWDWRQVNDWVNQKLQTVIKTETRKEGVMRK